MFAMRSLFAVLLGVVTLSADAGLVYRFTTKSDVSAQPQSGGGRVWIDGNRMRTELDPYPSNPRTHDVTIVVDGKTTYLNLQNKTYFHEQKVPAGGRLSGSSTLFHLPTMGDPQLRGTPKISYRNAGAGPQVGDYATTKHVIEFRYRLRTEIAGTGLYGDITGTLTVLTAPSLPRLEDTVFVRTTYPEIDGEVAKHAATFEGMLVGRELVASRKLEGGPKVTERTSMTIEELKTVESLDDQLFAIPPGFRFQEPVLAVPGV